MNINYKDFPMYDGQKFWFFPKGACSYDGFRSFVVEANIEDGTGKFHWKAIGDLLWNVNSGTVSVHADLDFSLDMDARISIEDAFQQYQMRPECAVGDICLHPHTNGIFENQDDYLLLLTGCALIRAHRNNVHIDPDSVLSKVYQCTNWLMSTDFFTAPASSHYHEAFKGGLCYHTLQVVRNIYKLWPAFCNAPGLEIENAVLIALVHDWCKIGLYEAYIKNVKNNQTDTWEKQEAFRRKDKFYVPLGHGVSSYFLASRFFRLSLEEIAAIRWHMGRWNVSDEEVNEFQQANETFPEVHLIQFADQLAITNYMVAN